MKVMLHVSLGAAGLSTLALIYYVSWRYAARWVCKLLLRERVVFPAPIKPHGDRRNGIGKENGEYDPLMNHEVVGSVISRSIGASDSGAAQRQRASAPYIVTDGVLAEISQL